MATSAVNQAIPAPASDFFLNGESGVGVAGSPSGGTTYRFARNFFAERSGMYLFKVWLHGTGQVLIGPNLAGLQTLIQPAPQQPIETQVYLQKGVNRIDVRTTTPVSFAFVMLIYHPDRIVYASSAQGWVYNPTIDVPDNEVPAPTVESLPVFSVLPNWGAGISERVSYLTDIPTSETGRESARLVRYAPRRYFEAEFLRKAQIRARLDHFLTGIGRRVFWMPLWHEQFKLTSTLGSTVQFPAGTLSLREFMVGDHVVVLDSDPDNYELLTVAELDFDEDVLTFAASPLQTWVAGARIIPVRRAQIVSQTSFSAPVDRVARGRIAFELVDPEYRFGSSWGDTSPVWRFPINRAEDITFAFDRMSYALDTQTGVPEYVDPGQRVFVTQRSNLILRERRMVVDYRRFIDMAAGRANRFYMPTRMQDILPIGDTIGGSTLDALPTGFSEYMKVKQWARTVLALIFRDGSTTICRSIEDVMRVGNIERFILSSTLPTISVSSLERIQFMVPSRFDQDTFEFEHLVDESAAVRTSAMTRSVDGDGMPELEEF